MASSVEEATGDDASAQFVRPDLRDARYSAVESPEALASSLNLPLSSILKVNANENSYGAHPSVVAAATAAIESQCHVYPDPTGPLALRERLASEFGPSEDCSFSAANVVVGAGSDDVIEVLLRVTGASRVVTCTPTFGMYAFLGKQYRAAVVDVARDPKNAFAVNIKAVIEAASRCSTGEQGKLEAVAGRAGPTIVFITTPNNPTGTITSTEDIAALCEGLRDSALVVIDEAYIEFVDHFVDSASSLLPRFSNLVILRTFSKWAGLAGLRVGFSLCARTLAQAMLACRQPYHVNVVAATSALTALDHRTEIMRSVRTLYETTLELRRILSGREFSSMLHVIPGNANFVLCEVTDRPAALLFEQLRELGVMARYFGSQGGALESHIRFSAPRAVDLERLVSSLRAARDGTLALAVERAVVRISAHAPEAILWDLDGVLADVSSSYRQAIIQTAQFFGAVISQNDISQIKALGDANNDWIVTQRILQHHLGDRAPSFEAVKEKFEEVYQGNADIAGLWQTERLLVEREVLERLATRFPMAIVTGRPREPDTTRFLEHFNLRELFKAVVCADDTIERKPSSQPVQLAMEKLGSPRSAVFIGDTVDDICAAIATGKHVLPIGVLTPSARDSIDELQTLLSAGAAGVLAPGCGRLFEAVVYDRFRGISPAVSLDIDSKDRSARVTRTTLETNISVDLDIDGAGQSSINTGVGFFDHMLSALAKHGRLNLEIACTGDLHIDDHHTVEDVSIALGTCLKRAIGTRQGIRRYGSAYAPLDDALARAVVDVSSRPYACVNLHLTRERIGDISSEMLSHALESLCTAAKLTVHVTVLTPDANNHHKAEAAFKALALALREALSRDTTAGVPSTKGVL